MAMVQDSDITRQIPLVANPSTTPGKHCPDPSSLAAYVESRLGPTERTELEAHVADCSYCLAQVGFLVRSADQELPAVPSHLLDAVQSKPAPWHFRIPRPAVTALAAAAIVILAATVVLHLDKSGTESTIDSASESLADRTVRNGAAMNSAPRILEPLDGTLLPNEEIELRWQESPQVLQYTVLLVSLQGDLLWEGRTTGTRTVIPAEAVVAGERYFVWIEAHLRGGGSLKSPSVGFRVATE